MTALDGVILAGGRAERLGGASKADLVVDGRRLIDTAIAAARSAGCARIVVVGPESLEAPGCMVVREAPPFGGPVAAVDAGLAALAAAEPAEAGTDVLVLACDMPAAEAAAARLVAARARHPQADGVCLADTAGSTQWLAAVYARRPLHRALDALAGPERDRAGVPGAAMRRLAASLDLVTVDDGGSTPDIDTWDDLALHRTEGRRMTEPLPPEALDEWVAEAAALLGIDPADVPVVTVLDLARRVAHGVARPAAPVTTFLLGLAVGAGTGDTAPLADRLGDAAEAHLRDA